jgi:hypothetical protein
MGIAPTNEFIQRRPKLRLGGQIAELVQNQQIAVYQWTDDRRQIGAAGAGQHGIGKLLRGQKADVVAELHQACAQGNRQMGLTTTSDLPPSGMTFRSLRP